MDVWQLWTTARKHVCLSPSPSATSQHFPPRPLLLQFAYFGSNAIHLTTMLCLFEKIQSEISISSRKTKSQHGHRRKAVWLSPAATYDLNHKFQSCRWSSKTREIEGQFFATPYLSPTKRHTVTASLDVFLWHILRSVLFTPAAFSQHGTKCCNAHPDRPWEKTPRLKKE